MRVVSWLHSDPNGARIAGARYLFGYTVQPMLGYLLGGLGLFLIGMALLTQGLRGLAGGALRRVLARATLSPMRAFATGAVATALVQSSSATTLMTIGFVSAGLIPFTASMGIIVGTNVGTTSTGWLVSLIGLKFGVSQLALPIVGLGGLLWSLGKGKVATYGVVTAGFGLLFIGIDTLQAGMAHYADTIDLTAVSRHAVFGTLALAAIGAVMTVAMQSSSAAVATTLTALHAGAIDLNQAAALVIGQNVGTTVTAFVAGINASQTARQTAATHILFNLGTGLVALIFLPGFLWLAIWIREFVAGDPNAIALAAFHTAFNLVGAAIFMPILPRLARVIERFVHSPEEDFSARLDRSVAQVPAVATEATRSTLRDIAVLLAKLTRRQIGESVVVAKEGLEQAKAGLDAVGRFLGEYRADPEDPDELPRHEAMLHAFDHLREWARHLQLAPDRTVHVPDHLREAVRKLSEGIPEPDVAEKLSAYADSVKTANQVDRHRLLQDAAGGQCTPAEALARLDDLRWSEAVMRSISRSLHYLS